MNAVEFTKKAKVSKDATHRLLNGNKIPEAHKAGRDWVIPDDWFERYGLRRNSGKRGARLDVYVKQANKQITNTSEKKEDVYASNALSQISDDIMNLPLKDRLKRLGSAVYDNIRLSSGTPKDYQESLNIAVRFEKLVVSTEDEQNVEKDGNETNDELKKLREKINKGNSKWKNKIKDNQTG